jgi:hypothetical protein
VTYGYFPTVWRRWPEQFDAMAPQPEQVPTPAAQPTGPQSPTDTQPSAPAAPTQPETQLPFDTTPVMPDTDAPPGPPDDDGPKAGPRDAMPFPPLDDEPFAPPPTAPAPSLDDTPPSMPSEPKASGAPPTPSTTPTGDLGPGEALPRMPDDDPFKDDPQQMPSPPTTKSGAITPRREANELELLRQAEQLDAVPMQTNLKTFQADLNAELDEPRRLEDAEDTGTARLPDSNVRSNPLRSASVVRPRAAVVPAAGFHAKQPKPARTADVEVTAWRKNPLRSN